MARVECEGCGDDVSDCGESIRLFTASVDGGGDEGDVAESAVALLTPLDSAGRMGGACSGDGVCSGDSGCGCCDIAMEPSSLFPSEVGSSA